MSGLSKALKWTDDHIGDLSGKIYVVTGANSGIGYEATRFIAHKGGKVIMACRSESKALKAIDDLVNGTSDGKPISSVDIKIKRENLDFIQLDLSDLASIERFGQQLLERYPKVDCLICNAGIMALPKREETVQGFELQMGVNVFGHYAFVCRTIQCLQNAVTEGAPKPRLVFLSSIMHKFAFGVSFADIDRKKSYSKWNVYCETKLGDLLLMHKFAEKYPQFDVVACHPGYSATNLQDESGMSAMNAVFAQSAAVGSLPTVMAAADPKVKSLSYIGPQWVSFGLPTHASMTSYAKDKKLADQLFQVCEEKTSVAAPTF